MVEINVTRFAGYSDEQVESILSEIASTASILVEQLRNEVADCGGSEMAIHAAIVLGEKIGLLADSTTHNPVVGDYRAWLMGGNFDELGTMAKGADHA